MKSVYFIGAGPLGAPTIRQAGELGLRTLVTDRNPDAPGFAWANAHAVIDGTDIAGHLAFAQTHRESIGAVVCGAEFGTRTVHALQELCDLPRSQSAAIDVVLDKQRMGDALRTAGIPTPGSTAVSSEAELRKALEQQKAPLVVKPVDGSGSRGVRILAPGRLSADSWARLHEDGTCGSFVVEPYLAGRQIDANGFFLDGCYHPLGELEKFTTAPPDCLPLGGHDPARLTDIERERVHALLEASARAVGLDAGPVKGDFILTEQGFFVLEVAARFHGDVTTVHTLPFGSRIAPYRFWFRSLLEGRPALEELGGRGLRAAHATWRVPCLPPGRVLHLPSPPVLGDDSRLRLVWNNPRVSELVVPYRNTARIPGYVAAWGHDAAEAEVALATWFTQAAYRIEPDPAHADWYAALGDRLDALGFSRAGSGYRLTAPSRLAA